jgi:multidrug resistance efflux pump
MKGSNGARKEGGLRGFAKSRAFRLMVATIAFAVALFLIFYLNDLQATVYIENSEISAPVITLSPAAGGVLDSVFVREGDLISANTIVARVSGAQIMSKIDGLVISVQNTPGQLVTAQTPVVQMIDPGELRVVGHIEEDKGLSDIKLGQNVVFTVDAFGDRQYSGVVDSISPTSRAPDIVFSISDKRQEQEFDIGVKFDIGEYPELKNGMSARMWVYK